MDDKYKIRFKHLVESNRIVAAEGEMLLSQNSGHISVKDRDYTRSATKDIEAGLSSLHDMMDLRKENGKTRYKLAYGIELLKHDDPDVELPEDKTYQAIITHSIDTNYDIKDIGYIIEYLEERIQFVEGLLDQSIQDSVEILKPLNGMDDLIEYLHETSNIIRYDLYDHFHNNVVGVLNEAEFLVETVKNRLEEAEFLYRYIMEKRPMGTAYLQEQTDLYNKNKSEFATKCSSSEYDAALKEIIANYNTLYNSYYGRTYKGETFTHVALATSTSWKA